MSKPKTESGQVNDRGHAAAARPAAQEDWLNARIYHPLSAQIARALFKSPISPNMVSFTGFLAIVLAGIAYTSGPGMAAIATGFLLHLSWHVIDGADGDLARLRGTASPRGEVIDGICDYAGHIVLYVLLARLLAGELGAAAWIWMSAAGIGRILQANFYEVQRRQYQWWVYDRSWLATHRKSQQAPGGLLGALGTAYLALARATRTGGDKIDALFAHASEAERTILRQLVVKNYQTTLRYLPLLGANYRTIALGIAMFAGSPLYYAVFEAIALTLIMLGVMLLARRANARVIAQFQPSSSR